MNCKASWNTMILLANLQPKLNKCYVLNKHNEQWIPKRNLNQKRKIRKIIFKRSKFHLTSNRIFNFWRQMFKYKHALFHSCFPYLDFLIQMIHLCKSNFIYLIEINWRFLETFSSIVAYWHALENMAKTSVLKTFI